jgi:hypothetical protein
MASLVFSLLSFILGPLGCIPGIIFGHIARAQIKKDPSLEGTGLALSGLIIGYLFTILLLTLAFLIIFTEGTAEQPFIYQLD